MEREKIDLVAALQRLVYDPLGYVRFAYSWGEGVLKGEDGPDENQARILKDIGELSKQRKAIYVAIRSGNEVGKTALIAWLIDWYASTRPHLQGVATANTGIQLNTKTWRELAKWHNLSIHKDWFEWTATKFYNRLHPETWFVAAISWSKDRPQAFAGTHEKYVIMVFDEASIIDDSIWGEADQAMSEGGLWVVAGNPSHNTGRFAECFKRFRHMWNTYTIDARTAKKANQDRIKKLIEAWGEDSDYINVHVKGLPPSAATTQFIPLDLIQGAQARQLVMEGFTHAPIVFGVDVARFGDDQTVIYVRQGGATLEIRKFRGIDTMQTVGFVTEMDSKHKPQAIFVDEIGIGAGVVDRLHQLGYKKVIGINSGNKAQKDDQYFNKRSEMWGETKEWLRTGSIPMGDQELEDDLIGPEYGFDGKNRIKIESADDMKARGLASPDTASALALTFALPVYMKSDIEIQREILARQRPKHISLNPDGGY
jgi:hypothetical protein